MNFSRLIAGEHGKEEAAQQGEVTNRNSTDIDVKQAMTSNSSQSDDTSSSSEVGGWSPHYSDGDYGNQMSCPRMQSKFPSYY